MSYPPRPPIGIPMPPMAYMTMPGPPPLMQAVMPVQHVRYSHRHGIVRSKTNCASVGYGSASIFVLLLPLIDGRILQIAGLHGFNVEVLWTVKIVKRFLHQSAIKAHSFYALLDRFIVGVNVFLFKSTLAKAKQSQTGVAQFKAGYQTSLRRCKSTVQHCRFLNGPLPQPTRCILFLNTYIILSY